MKGGKGDEAVGLQATRGVTDPVLAVAGLLGVLKWLVEVEERNMPSRCRLAKMYIDASRDVWYMMSIREVQVLVRTPNDESGPDIGTGMRTSANEMILLTTKGTGGQWSSGIRRNR